MVFVAVNLDPHNAHGSEIGFPLPEMGIAPDALYRAEELLTGDRFEWRGPVQHVRLDPQHHPAVIFRVGP
jgi:starch synthase (maltosyl-transferring)